MVELTKEMFEGEVIGSDMPYVVDFWASWCGPCQMVAPVIAQIAEEYAGKIKVGKVNVDEEGSLAAEYAIVSIPTILIFKNGKVEKKLVGARSYDDFCDEIDAVI